MDRQRKEIEYLNEALKMGLDSEEAIEWVRDRQLDDDIEEWEAAQKPAVPIIVIGELEDGSKIVKINLGSRKTITWGVYPNEGLMNEDIKKLWEMSKKIREAG